jgi:filamentous hemagglutinin family protein
MKLNPLILAILVFYQHPVLADIVTDGSVGNASNFGRVQPINPTSNGQITINQGLGSLEGKNLFHSFEKFDIDKGETATFTGDDAIQNVFSRVTGDNKSHINGILRSEIGSADFFFINPAGVVFDNNAQVDVPASFHVSTAGELIFADGSHFSALNPEASTLTVATPEAFGFSSEQNGSLEIIGGQLRFKPGTDVSLSANGLDIQQAANITVERTADFRLDKQPGLHLNLAAIDSATAHKIPVNNLTDTQATGGELSIENSRIDVSGNGAGRLTIRAGPMTVTESADDTPLRSGLFAYNFGAQDARETDGISIDVDALDLKDALISSSAPGDGDGSRIEIKAEQLKISGSLGGISQVGLAWGSPGKITVTVGGAIQINNKGSISSTKAGIIDVTAGQLTVDGPGSKISSDANVEGNAGAIKIIAKELMKIQNGGIISSDTHGPGDAGLVRVNTGQLTVEGSGSRISTDTKVEGNAGDVRVEAKELMKIQNGGIISSNTRGPGNAGEVVVVAGQLTVDGPGSQITSATNNKGNAGEVIVNAGQLTVIGTNEDNITGISTRASGKFQSNAGPISIIVDKTIQLLSHGQINTSSVDGDGGDITVISGEWIQLKDAIITTSVSGSSIERAGNIEMSDSSIDRAGNIEIKVPVLIMDTAEILAEANSEVLERQEGKIVISENLLVPSKNNIDSNRNSNSKNIIAGKRSGQIFNTSQSIVGALAGFPPPNLETEQLSQDPCAHRDENSLKKIGHGGAPAFQHGENYLPINRFDESEHDPEDMDTLQIMPSINTDHNNSATECDKSRRNSLN